ncbi:MAG: OmpA family protein [Betaproteobacteria bacterium]|nr:OmpA family protein [Betaproteobacteria bacterium]
MKSQSVFLSVAAAVLSIAPAFYTQTASAVDGYVTSRYNGEPLRTGDGRCVHDGFWQPGDTYRDCEPAPAAAAAPVPAPTPEPEPVVEAPVLKPIILDQPFKLSADTLFDFASAELKNEGRDALDDVVSQLATSHYETIVIVGHTDRIGSTAYNQKLSERRAAAMREYLIEKGVPADRINATGLGESNPTARCDHLRGKRLIACLQPDRFAELTVGGTVEVTYEPVQ